MSETSISVPFLCVPESRLSVFERVMLKAVFPVPHPQAVVYARPVAVPRLGDRNKRSESVTSTSYGRWRRARRG